MKMKYIKPEINTVLVRYQHNLMETSTIGRGSDYNGETVLSRKSSYWDEDDEE